MEVEIERLEKAVIILARAVESGRIEGIVEEVMEIMNYWVEPKKK